MAINTTPPGESVRIGSPSSLIGGWNQDSPIGLSPSMTLRRRRAAGSNTPAARVEEPVDTAGQIRRDPIHRPLRAADLLYSGGRGYMELDRRGAERL